MAHGIAVSVQDSGRFNNNEHGTIGCAFGPCIYSRERGGAGCKLCDVVAKLPQQRPANLKYPENHRKNAKVRKS